MIKGLIVICGATATGKSALAMALAEKLNTFIISADSRQVYQEFDIGTAKPQECDRTLIPHYLIDVCHPRETLTVAQYQSQVNQIINASEGIPIMVGGTGLYIKSVTKGLKIPPVAPQPQLRKQLENYSQGERYQFLGKVDQISQSKIHPNDEIRTIRALEVYYVTGKPISEQQGENLPPYPILHLGLKCDAKGTLRARTHLEERIRQRTQIMIEMGLVTETEKLMEKYGEDLPLLNTLGYAEIKEYLQGKIELNKAQELIVIHTRQFAKRQQTWFNAYPEIKWFNLNSSPLIEDVFDTVNYFIKHFQ